MFQVASVFNQALSFDTSKVTNMGYMFDGANSLSNGNKLLTRCAWAGTSAFASAGYSSSWGPGSCASPSPPPPSPPPSPPTQACTYTFTTKASLETAVQAYNANPTT